MSQKIKYLLLIFGVLIVGSAIYFSFQIKRSPRIILLPSREITLEISNGKIEPSKFEVKRGERILLKIVSLDGEHTFKFDLPLPEKTSAEFKESGETKFIEFYAPNTSGEYKFYCSQHREAGEEGVMIVE